MIPLAIVEQDEMLDDPFGVVVILYGSLLSWIEYRLRRFAGNLPTLKVGPGEVCGCLDVRVSVDMGSQRKGIRTCLNQMNILNR